MVKLAQKGVRSVIDFDVLPLNITIADVMCYHFDLHFQGQTFTLYAFAIKKFQLQWMSPADLTWLIRTRHGVALDKFCRILFNS